MDFYEKFDRLLKLEKEHDLYSLEYKDTPIWPYLRNKIYGVIHSEGASQVAATSIIKKPINLYNKNLLLSAQTEKRDCIVFNFNRHELINGSVKDTKTQKIKSELKRQDFSYYAVDFQSEGVYTNIFENFNIVDANIEYLKVMSESKNISLAELSTFDKISTLISEELDISFQIQNYMREISSKIDTYHSYFTDVFKKLQPKFIVLTSNYMRSEIIIPAKKLGIHIIEAQYAAIIDYHNGYYFKGNNNPFYPDTLLVWSEYYATYKNYPSNLKNIHIMGNDSISISTIPKINNKVLIVSQNLISKEMVKNTFKLLDQNPEYEFYFRKHPNESINNSVLEELRTYSNFHMDFDKLEDSLSSSAFVVGANSTVLLEAISYGCKILLVDTYMTKFMQRIVNEQYGYYLDSFSIKNYELLQYNCNQSVLAGNWNFNFDIIEGTLYEKNAKFEYLEYLSTKMEIYLSENKLLDFSDFNEVVSLNENKLSVIIPNYNAASYLTKLLEVISVFESSFGGELVKFIFIDDHSSDESIAIIKGFSHLKSVKLVENEIPSGGPSKPRMQGIDMTNSEFISFLDADDEPLLETLMVGLYSCIKYDLDFVKFCPLVRNEGGFSRFGVGPTRFFTKDLNVLKQSPFMWNHIYKTDIIKFNSIKVREGIAEDFNFNVNYYQYIKSGLVINQSNVIYNKLHSTFSASRSYKDLNLTLLNHIDTLSIINKNTDIFNKKFKKYLKQVIIEKYFVTNTIIIDEMSKFSREEQVSLENSFLKLYSQFGEASGDFNEIIIDILKRNILIINTAYTYVEDKLVFTFKNNINSYYDDFFNIKVNEEEINREIIIDLNSKISQKYKLNSKKILFKRVMFTTNVVEYNGEFIFLCTYCFGNSYCIKELLRSRDKKKIIQKVKYFNVIINSIKKVRKILRKFI